MDNNLQQVNMQMIMDAPSVACECGCHMFDQTFVVKEISGILVGSPNPNEYSPIPVFVCRKCGKLAPWIENDPRLKNLIDGAKKQESELIITK